MPIWFDLILSFALMQNFENKLMKVHLSELQNNIANKLFDCPFFVDRTS